MIKMFSILFNNISHSSVLPQKTYSSLIFTFHKNEKIKIDVVNLMEDTYYSVEVCLIWTANFIIFKNSHWGDGKNSKNGFLSGEVGVALASHSLSLLYIIQTTSLYSDPIERVPRKANAFHRQTDGRTWLNRLFTGDPNHWKMIRVGDSVERKITKRFGFGKNTKRFGFKV